MCFSLEVEMEKTTTDSGDCSLPVTDTVNEEPQAKDEKAPVRFGWVTGVMVSKAFFLYLSAKHRQKSSY